MAHGTVVDLARRYAEELINAKHLDLVDDLFAPDAVFHDPVAPRGCQEIKAFFAAVQQAMPDLHFTIEEVFGTADHGVWRGIVSATLVGALGSLPATGKFATAPIAEIFQRSGGQIHEVWVYFDTLSIMQQFGIVPVAGGG